MPQNEIKQKSYQWYHHTITKIEVNKIGWQNISFIAKDKKKNHHSPILCRQINLVGCQLMKKFISYNTNKIKLQMLINFVLEEEESHGMLYEPKWIIIFLFNVIFVTIILALLYAEKYSFNVPFATCHPF